MGLIYVTSLFIVRDTKQIHAAMFVAMLFWIVHGTIYSFLFYRKIRQIRRLEQN